MKKNVKIWVLAGSCIILIGPLLVQHVFLTEATHTSHPLILLIFVSFTLPPYSRSPLVQFCDTYTGFLRRNLKCEGNVRKAENPEDSSTKINIFFN